MMSIRNEVSTVIHIENYTITGLVPEEKIVVFQLDVDRLHIMKTMFRDDLKFMSVALELLDYVKNKKIMLKDKNAECNNCYVVDFDKDF